MKDHVNFIVTYKNTLFKRGVLRFKYLGLILCMDYINKMNSLLKDNGKLVGLLFDFRLTDEGPPFGGDADAYSLAFEKRFHLRTMSPCYNSIKPRLGNELFIIFEKIK